MLYITIFMRKGFPMYQKQLMKKFIAGGFAIAFCALAVLLSPSAAVKSNEVLADEQVHSVYTNELISSAGTAILRNRKCQDTL